METAACNICGGTEFALLHEFDLPGVDEPARLVRCRNCDLVFLSPRPSRDEIGSFYPKNYQEDMLRILAKANASPLMRFGFDMIRKRRTPMTAAPGRVLDIGCSNGALLAALRDRGWQVEGIEMDEAAARYARETRGLKVTQGSAEDALPEMPSDAFDAVTMWHLLEHLHDPVGALEQVRRILKPGGMLMLEVPDYSSPPASWFDVCWFPLDIPRHLYHFTRPTLNKALARAGLRLVDTSGIPSPEALVWSLAAKRQGRPIDFNRGDSLGFSPVLMALYYPLSWAMARIGKSDHMGAVAVRPA